MSEENELKSCKKTTVSLYYETAQIQYIDDETKKLEEEYSVQYVNDTDGETSNNTIEREHWDNKVEFVLACIGYSVGLGNVWRFGYLCSKSGGGAFLIPYFITLVLVALPLMYLEFALGQFTRRGPIGAIARICPLFKGTGIATVVISFFLTTYYVVIIAWVLYFLLTSFASQVPYAKCGNSWNTNLCWDGSLNNSAKMYNNTVSPSEEFFRRRILNESDSILNFGLPKIDLILLTFLAWVLVYFCIWKGVKSTGKVVYVTALLPYLVLFVMLFRGLSLEGAWTGVKYFILPEWNDILKPSVWANAAIQNFNSIGVGFGGLISMSSFNPPKKRIFGNVLTIAIVDAITSIVCGLTVFSVVGYISVAQSKPITDVIREGPGLIFMVLPEAIRNMTFAPFWSIIFFVMILLLGIDSQFTMVETVVATIEDECKPFFNKYIKRKEFLVLLVCVLTFFLTIPNLCPGGIFYFTLVDFYSAGISVFYIAFCEVVTIVWIYGANRLADNIKHMNGERPMKFVVICWYAITPLLILIIWAFNWINYEPIKYGKQSYPLGFQIFGWSIALVSIIAIPIAAIHQLVIAPGKTLYEKFLVSLKPTIMDLDLNQNDVLNESKNVNLLKPTSENLASF